MFEITSSPTNSMRGTPLSLSTKLTLLANQKLLLLYQTQNNIQSRSPGEWRRSLGLERDALKKLRGALVKYITLAHIYIEKLFKKQQSFVNNS